MRFLLCVVRVFFFLHDMAWYGFCFSLFCFVVLFLHVGGRFMT